MRQVQKLTMLALLILAAFATLPAQACPMCKDSAPINSSDQSTTAGNPTSLFNPSVLFMLGGFLATLSFTSVTIARGLRGKQ